MWVPVEEAGDDLDIEVIVPSEYDSSSFENDPDQPHYKHHQLSGGRQSKLSSHDQREHTISLSPQGHGRHIRRERQQRQKVISPTLEEEQDDLGFVDIDESDREENVLQLEVPISSGRSTPNEQYYQQKVRSPRRQFSRAGRLISARSTCATPRLDIDSPDPKNTQQMRRVFHRPSVFVPARYPAKFHKDSKSSASAATSKKARNAALKLPPSLRVKSRYGKEAILISNKTKRSALRQWPTPPIYIPKPKVRDTSVECHILRLVETLDIGTQNVPIMKTEGSQFGNLRKDTGTQYPRVKRKEIGLDPKENPVKSTGTQHVPETRNAMVETTVSVTYHPNIVVSEDRGTQATLAYNKEYGWSHITDAGSTDDVDWHSDTNFEKQDPNLLGVPQPHYDEANTDGNDNNYEEDFEREDDEDSFATASSQFSEAKPPAPVPALNLGLLPERNDLQPVLETHRELVGLPDSCSEDEEEEEEEGECELNRGADVLEGTNEIDRHLPPVSVVGGANSLKSNSLSSVQIPVEDDGEDS